MPQKSSKLPTQEAPITIFQNPERKLHNKKSTTPIGNIQNNSVYQHTQKHKHNVQPLQTAFTKTRETNDITITTIHVTLIAQQACAIQTTPQNQRMIKATNYSIYAQNAIFTTITLHHLNASPEHPKAKQMQLYDIQKQSTTKPTVTPKHKSNITPQLSFQQTNKTHIQRN
eukprot:gene2524-1579_t